MSQFASPEDLEKHHVRDVYDKIAPHFVGSHHKAWPRVEEFLFSLPLGSLIADVGKSVNTLKYLFSDWLRNRKEWTKGGMVIMYLVVGVNDFVSLILYFLNSERLSLLMIFKKNDLKIKFISISLYMFKMCHILAHIFSSVSKRALYTTSRKFFCVSRVLRNIVVLVFKWCLFEPHSDWMYLEKIIFS